MPLVGNASPGVSLVAWLSVPCYLSVCLSSLFSDGFSICLSVPLPVCLFLLFNICRSDFCPVCLSVGLSVSRTSERPGWFVGPKVLNGVIREAQLEDREEERESVAF